MGALRRGARNAFRNTARTLGVVLIVSITFALALVMLVSHQAASDGVSSVSSSLGTTVIVTPTNFFGFGGSGNALTGTDVQRVAATPHVVSVTSSITERLTNASSSSGFGGRFGGQQGTTSLTSPLTLGALGRRFGNFGGFTPPAANTPAPVTVVGSTTPLNSSLLQATTATLTKGTLIDGSSSARVADVGSALATKNHLTVGSTFTAYDKTFTVEGIFTTNESQANAALVVPLKTLQTLSGIDGVTSITATVDNLGNVAAAATSIQSTLGTSVANVTSSQTSTSAVASELSSIKTISLFSLLGAIIAAAAILLMSMLMIVRERRREIGILKAFGSSNAGVVSTFGSEALTITLLSAVLGTVLGLVLANPVLNLLKSSSATTGGRGGFTGGPRFGGGSPNFTAFGTSGLSNLHAVLGTNVAVYAVLIAIAVALFGSIVPAYAIAKVRPAEVMRSES
jgi:putative ABC transport system permease protein